MGMTEGTFQHCNDLWNAREQIVESKFEPITPQQCTDLKGRRRREDVEKED